MADVPQSGRGFRLLVGAAALVIVIAGLKAAAAVLVPVLAAAFLAVISLPPVRWLEKRRLPGWAAVVVVLLGVFVVLGAVSIYVGASIKDFTENLPAYEANLAGQVDSWIAWLRGLGVDVSRRTVAENIDTGALVAVFGDAVAAMGSILSDSLFVMLTMVFILAEAAGLPGKVRRALGDPKADLRGFTQVLDSIQGYLGVKTWVSLVTGILAGAAVAAVGVDYPLLWGLIAFLLNYIPALGSVIAAVPPTLLALVQHGWERALVVVAAFAVINLVMGNVIEPRFMGRRLGLSTLVVFLSMVFWGWVLGPVGMVLSVPLTMLVKIGCEQSADLRWVGVLLGPGDEAPRAAASRR